MKKNVFLSLGLIIYITSFGQITIHNLPLSSYPSTKVTSIIKSTIESQSSNFTGLPKIDGINSTFPYAYTNNTTFWPTGAWGRGYNTIPGITETIFFQESSSIGGYYACHPLMRDVSMFVRGHLHLFLSGHTSGNSELKVKQGIDYILSQQISTGGNIGAFNFWIKRQSQTNINMTIPENSPHVYETAYGLVALSEYYLSNINYRRPEVLNAIELASLNIVNLNYFDPANDNSNIRGLAIWALSIAYKVTLDCNNYNKIKQLATYLINNQTISTTDDNGLWETGGQETISPYIIMHDTKIYYHMMILRGLIETMDVTPDQDTDFKLELVNAIKRGINHVIDYRLDNSSGNAYKLRYLFKTIAGGYTPTTSGWYKYDFVDVDKLIEPLVKLAYYAKNSIHFNTQERTNLTNLTNKVSYGLFAYDSDPNHHWLICGLGYYVNYINALPGTVLQWTGANINYSSSQITNRMVSGDFDNDGYEDDIAAFYDYSGATTLHVWKSQGDHFDYQTSNGWWSSPSYTASQISGRVVSGDFDRDGWKDDIAAFYDYGGGNTRIHVWISNGSSFSCQDYWWNTSGYSASQITGRVVSGDFDRDGYFDDIAAFYDYGSEITRIHIWRSTGTTFQYQGGYGWWNVSGYTASKITGRVVSGDFDSDGYHDDIAAFYDYGSEQTKMHVWRSNVGSFTYHGAGKWDVSGYNSNMITNRVISGDFDNDNNWDDIAAFYNYGGEQTKIHVWTASNSGNITYYGSGWWSANGYTADMITGRIVSGNFDNDFSNKTDIAVFYNYGPQDTRANVFKSSGSSFGMAVPTSWWLNCWTPLSMLNMSLNDSQVDEEMSQTKSISYKKDSTFYIETDYFTVAPNPSTGVFYLKIDDKLLSELRSISIYDLSGKLVFETNSFINEPLLLEEKGIYFIFLTTQDSSVLQKKIIIV